MIDFVLESALLRADETLVDRRYFGLDADRWTAFMAAPGIGAHDNPTVRLDADNEPQPDAVLRIERGGRSTISDDGYIEGALATVLQVLQQGIATSEHHAFVTGLQ